MSTGITYLSPTQGDRSKTGAPHHDGAPRAHDVPARVVRVAIRVALARAEPAGSAVFAMTPGPVDLHDPSRWWRFVPDELFTEEQAAKFSFDVLDATGDPTALRARHGTRRRPKAPRLSNPRRTTQRVRGRGTRRIATADPA